MLSFAQTMTLTTHAAIGAAIGTVVGNPVLGFFLGAASHFLVDMIPHGDNELSDRFRVQKKKNIPVAYVTVDGVCTAILIALFASVFHENITPAFAAAIIGSTLPDLLVGIAELFKKNTLFRAYYKFHFFFHDFFSRKYGDAPLTAALLGQGVAIILIIYAIS